MPPLYVITYEALNLTPSTFVSEVAGEYDFRIEPLQDGKFPTIRRLRIWYRDIGVSDAVFTLYGVYEDGTADSQVGALTAAMGTVAAPGTVKQVYVDFTKTMLNPQLKITGSGPIAIIRIIGIGQLQQLDTL